MSSAENVRDERIEERAITVANEHGGAGGSAGNAGDSVPLCDARRALFEPQDEQARQRANAAWNASGAYGATNWWTADRLPFGMGGAADAGEMGARPAPLPREQLYAMTATGLVAKRLDEAAVCAALAAWEEDYRAARLNDAAWAYFTEAAYQLDQAERPALEDLRAAFVGALTNKQRRLVAQAEGASGEVLESLRTPNRTSSEEIACSACLADVSVTTPAPKDTPEQALPHGQRQISSAPLTKAQFTDALIAALPAFMRTAAHFDGRVRKAGDTRLHLGVSILGLALRKNLDAPQEDLLAAASRQQEREEARGGAGRSDRQTSVRAGEREGADDRDLRGKAKRDLAYVRSCFGEPLLPLQEMRRLEQACCVGAHEGCRLWIADGRAPLGSVDTRSLRQTLMASQAQCEENRSYLAANRAHLDATCAQLAQRLEEVLHHTASVRVGRQCRGRFDATRAWRADVLDDSRIFSREERVEAPDLAVDLFLDASGSRTDEQRDIAAQARTVARAFVRCGVPVRASAFCSLRGYTVLRFFNGLDADPQATDEVLRYFAAGLNRDGLALRALGELPAPTANAGTGRPRRLVLMMTDASPMDSFAGRSYAGAQAVADTAQAVRDLRRRGIAVAGIVTHAKDQADHADEIFGTSSRRIHDPRQLPAAVSDLVANACVG